MCLDYSKQGCDLCSEVHRPTRSCQADPYTGIAYVLHVSSPDIWSLCACSVDIGVVRKFWRNSGGLTAVCSTRLKHWLSTTSWRRIGEWRYGSTIVNLCIGWWWAIILTPLPLYTRYPLGKRVGGPQSRAERCGVKKICCPCRESNMTVQPEAPCPSYICRLPRK
jgi:hypothetical protein